MMGFIEAQEARYWTQQPADKRREAVIGSFVRYFGERAAKPRGYMEKSWAEEEFTRGCYSGYAPPGVLTSYGESIRRPHGRLHWAGAETATFWNGFMDGAVTAGERAAKEALGDL
jgi:monoamine oxidase